MVYCELIIRGNAASWLLKGENTQVFMWTKIAVLAILIQPVFNMTVQIKKIKTNLKQTEHFSSSQKKNFDKIYNVLEIVSLFKD